MKVIRIIVQFWIQKFGLPHYKSTALKFHLTKLTCILTEGKLLNIFKASTVIKLRSIKNRPVNSFSLYKKLLWTYYIPCEGVCLKRLENNRIKVIPFHRSHRLLAVDSSGCEPFRIRCNEVMNRRNLSYPGNTFHEILTVIEQESKASFVTVSLGRIHFNHVIVSKKYWF